MSFHLDGFLSAHGYTFELQIDGDHGRRQPHRYSHVEMENLMRVEYCVLTNFEFYAMLCHMENIALNINISSPNNLLQQPWWPLSALNEYFLEHASPNFILRSRINRARMFTIDFPMSIILVHLKRMRYFDCLIRGGGAAAAEESQPMCTMHGHSST